MPRVKLTYLLGEVFDKSRQWWKKNSYTADRECRRKNSISTELNITCHMVASQLSNHNVLHHELLQHYQRCTINCDVITRMYAE